MNDLFLPQRYRGHGDSLTQSRKAAKVWILLLFVVLFGSGCDVGRSEEVVKVGVVAPFDGEAAGIGYDVLYSVRLAVREVNEDGGIDGVRVLPVIYSDSSDPVKAREVAEALVVDPAVVAVIGHWDGETTDAAVDVYEEASMALVRMGDGGLGTFDPAGLPAEFSDAYNGITFEQSGRPGIWSGTAYDGMQLVFRAIGQDVREDGVVDRASVAGVLDGIMIDGLTGEVFVP